MTITRDQAQKLIDKYITTDWLKLHLRETEVIMRELAKKFEQDEEQDHLLELHEILERHDDQQDPLVSDEIYGRRRFDVCSDCYKAFIGNPLGQEIPKVIDFSQN